MIRRLGHVLLAGFVVLASACSGDGHFALLGYSSKPWHDTKHKTMRIPMVKTRSQFVVTPVIGMEHDLHRALIAQVPLRTPYRVTHADADTELTVKIRSVTKSLINLTQQNNVREAEWRIEAEIVWRDLRTGLVLTRPGRRPGQPLDHEGRQPILEGESVIPPPLGVPGRPGNPATARADEEPLIDPSTRRPVVPVVVRAVAYSRPELGSSTTTAMKDAMDQLAVQILQALEDSWDKCR
ncbi:MAG: hypothetical protein K2W96_09945 [Gemmataceae bacterium]|nr:hypothetical protein [Gemmataceae bacterium]